MEHDGAPYEQWCGFIDTVCRGHESEVKTVLEVGCGTGSMMQRWRTWLPGHRCGTCRRPCSGRHGRSLFSRSNCVQAHLPDPELPDLGPYDAAICCFDVVNYFVDDGQLARVFAQVKSALRPGGVFIFDVNTQYKLETLFGDRSFGDDFGDFAYVQKARYDPAHDRCELLLTFFLLEGEMYRRVVEHHVQRWFSDAEMYAAVADSGFEVQRTCQGYMERHPYARDCPCHLGSVGPKVSLVLGLVGYSLPHCAAPAAKPRTT